MLQKILKPDSAANGSYVVQGPLSQNELQLKKVLDLTQLLPGDLILVSAVTPDFVGRNIRKVQARGGYLDEHAMWEHAALYVGKGVICEATRKGVRRAMLSKYVGKHYIRVRRNTCLTVEQRYELAIHALTLHDFRYDFREIVRLWKNAHFGFSNSTKATVQFLGKQYPKRATICSQLYADCHVSVTKTVIGNLDGGETTPASLSISTALEDVQLDWLTIAQLSNPSPSAADRPSSASPA